VVSVVDIQGVLSNNLHTGHTDGLSPKVASNKQVMWRFISTIFYRWIISDSQFSYWLVQLYI